MMKTMHIDFPIWTNDKLYYIKDSTIKETHVYNVRYKLSICTKKSENSTSAEYELINGTIIKDEDLGVKYFTNKKELIQKLVSQL